MNAHGLLNKTSLEGGQQGRWVANDRLAAFVADGWKDEKRQAGTLNLVSRKAEKPKVANNNDDDDDEPADNGGKRPRRTAK